MNHSGKKVKKKKKNRGRQHQKKYWKDPSTNIKRKINSKEVHYPSKCCTCIVGTLHSSSAISQYNQHGNGGYKEERGDLLHPHMNLNIYSIPRETNVFKSVNMKIRYN